MNEYRVTPEATVDLHQIYDYVARDDPIAADSLFDEFFEKFDLLAEYPEAGRERGELASGVRSIAAGNHVIYYLALPSHVSIVRVIHGARDVADLGLH